MKLGQTMTPNSAHGQIITFYSYKGGTGRSMALANVAWILAANRKKVFVIDWDLEAPGLHRYFRPFLIDKELSNSNGLIDVVHAYVEETVERLAENPDAFADTEDLTQWVETFANISNAAISLEYKFAGEGYIDFLPAGRQIAAYAERVNTFNWHQFYKRFGGGEFLEAIKRRLRTQYDYVLIDSRTGVSDTSGISTVQMPDILAVCFTYNNQSMAGAAAVAESVRDARVKSGLEAFRIFPIPTRVEQSERVKLAVRQNYARHRFAALIDHIPEDLRTSYWTEVEIPYIPFHAYEETLAALTDDPNDDKLVLKAIRRITSYLTNNTITTYQPNVNTEVLKGILKEFTNAHMTQGSLEPSLLPEDVTPASHVAPLDVVTQADLQMASLNESDAISARKLWQRLVSVRESSAGPLLSSWPVEEKLLLEEQRRIASTFQHAGLLRKYEAGGTIFIEIANDALLRRWEPLQVWVKEDRAFLEWRAQLTEARQRWENNVGQTRFLLTGPILENGSSWVKARRDDLTDEDVIFFHRSKERASRKSRVFGVSMGMLAFGITAAMASYALYQRQSALEAGDQVRKVYAVLNQAGADRGEYVPALRGSSAEEILPPLPSAIGHSTDGDDNANSRAVTAVRKVFGGLEAERRSTIELTYFAKAGDPPNTAPELSKLGYKISLGASPLVLPTNTVWFGCSEPLTSSDIRELALLLMHEGVALRKLDTFAGKNSKIPLIHIGAAKASLRVQPLTVAEVEAFDIEVACRQKR
jgi:MinD-like ATPase involved in chromosome partitioning or flagellar assembly